MPPSHAGDTTVNDDNLPTQHRGLLAADSISHTPVTFPVGSDTRIRVVPTHHDPVFPAAVFDVYIRGQ